MFDKFDLSILWVSSSAVTDGDGRFDSPFSSMDRALSIVKPGGSIVLKSGTYPYISQDTWDSATNMARMILYQMNPMLMELAI